MSETAELGLTQAALPADGIGTPGNDTTPAFRLWPQGFDQTFVCFFQTELFLSTSYCSVSQHEWLLACIYLWMKEGRVGAVR